MQRHRASESFFPALNHHVATRCVATCQICIQFLASIILGKWTIDYVYHPRHEKPFSAAAEGHKVVSHAERPELLDGNCEVWSGSSLMKRQVKRLHMISGYSGVSDRYIMGSAERVSPTKTECA